MKAAVPRSHDIQVDMTSVISHQFKTPLAGLKSSLEVLQSGALGQLSVPQADYVRMALGNVERMVGLVHDLLDASKIDQDSLQLSPAPTDLIALAKKVVADVHPFASAANTTVTFATSGDITSVNVDGPKIEQVMSNLLYNAIRYGQGKGTVDVRLRRDGGSIVFSCADRGIGIPQAEQAKLFSKFYRSRKAIEVSPTGSGLGLYIAKAIVEQSGGKIWFTTAEEQGTTFLFSLPIIEGATST